jgi:peptide deformylase
VKLLKICKAKDPSLHEPCQEVSLKEIRTKEFQNIIESMLDIVYGKSNKGKSRDTNKPTTVGLSASQVGINKRISIVDLGVSHKSYNDLHVLINTEIYWYSKTKVRRSEGCVNLPEIWAYIDRAKRIKVRAYDRSGNRIELDLNGWPAILLQHETDHLNGKLFIDRLDNPKKAYRVKKGQLREYKKLKTKWNHFIDVSSLIKNQ